MKMSAHILVVDDLEVNRDMLTRRLQQQAHRVDMAEGGVQALEKLGADRYDLVLLDLMMPGMDGSEVLQRIKSDVKLRHIPVIMVSASDELDNVVRCIELGAEDYLPKPFSPVLLRARVNASLQKKRLHDQEAELRTQLQQSNTLLGERVRAQVREITSAQTATIFAMSKLAESRDPEAGGRLERLREYVHVLARQLVTLPRYQSLIEEAFIDAIYAAAPLLDIGKVGIPDAVLSKAARLEPAEWEIMKAHTLIGGDMLRAVDREHPGNIFIRTGIEIAEGHHEKWDGSGYPRGAAGDAIPLSARIVALADAYDGLVSPRGCKQSFSHDEARQVLADGANRHFDPEVVDAFLRVETEFVRIRRRFQDPERPAPRLAENA